MYIVGAKMALRRMHASHYEVYAEKSKIINAFSVKKCNIHATKTLRI